MKTDTRTKPTFAELPATYEGLCAIYLPRPIHDQVGYETAEEMIDALAGHALNPAQADYLAIISDMVEAYENATLPPEPKPDPIALLKYLMEEHEMNGDALAGVLGVDRSVAYRILKGERKLTASHVKALAARFSVSPALFLS